MMNIPSFACIFLVFYAASCDGHSRFVCPRPESGNSGIKSGPCSSEGNKFKDTYMDITPGPLTLRWEESINHKDAPQRFTLNKHGDKKNVCMLLDQVPQNRNGSMNIGAKCFPFDWPVGFCKTQYYVTVNIPDIECDRCYLQMVSIMTDKYFDSELPCWQKSQAMNNCSSYYSCANIRIRPTAAGKGKGIDSCMDYSKNRMGDWPYLPEKDPKFARDYYRRHGIEYTKQGWLQGPEFTGKDATYPFALQPHGPCIPETKYYGGTVTRGIMISLTVTENHAWVRAASYRYNITSIKLSHSRNSTVPPLDLPSNFISADKHTYNAVVDVSKATKAGKMYDWVEITTSQSEQAITWGTSISHAAPAAIMSGERMVGEALVEYRNVLPHGHIRYLAMVSMEDEIKSISVNGPARWGQVGQQLVLLNLTKTSNGVIAQGTTKMSLAVLDGLRAVQLYIDVQTNDSTPGGRGVSAQLPKVEPCTEDKCFSALLTYNGGALDMSKKIIETNGYTTILLSNVELQYKVTLRDVRAGDEVQSVRLSGPSQANDTVIHEGSFTHSTLEDKVHYRQGSLKAPSRDLLKDLAAGDVTMRVYTTRYPVDGVYGKLPAITPQYI